MVLFANLDYVWMVQLDEPVECLGDLLLSRTRLLAVPVVKDHFVPGDLDSFFGVHRQEGSVDAGNISLLDLRAIRNPLAD